MAIYFYAMMKHKTQFKEIWARAQQNKQNDLCTQLRLAIESEFLLSAWWSDQSLLHTWWAAKDTNF